jgi:SHS2 domain-containing protein
MGKFEIIDHTADLAMKITGDNPVDFFVQALLGLRTLTEMDQAKLSERNVVNDLIVYGNDLEEILVHFLNELVRLIQESEMSPLQLQDLEIFSDRLSCKVLSKSVIEFPDGYVEIKSATYHMLKINNDAGKLSATVILDI